MPSPFTEDGPGESLPIDADPFADLDGRTSMEILEAAADRYDLPRERLVVMAWKQTGFVAPEVEEFAEGEGHGPLAFGLLRLEFRLRAARTTEPPPGRTRRGLEELDRRGLALGGLELVERQVQAGDHPVRSVAVDDASALRAVNETHRDREVLAGGVHVILIDGGTELLDERAHAHLVESVAEAPLVVLPDPLECALVIGHLPVSSRLAARCVQNSRGVEELPMLGGGERRGDTRSQSPRQGFLRRRVLVQQPQDGLGTRGWGGGTGSSMMKRSRSTLIEAAHAIARSRRAIRPVEHDEHVPHACSFLCVPRKNAARSPKCCPFS